jgi:hypothetical protein
MSHVKNFKDWQRLFEEAQQMDQQKMDWDEESMRWAKYNQYLITDDYDRYGEDIFHWDYQKIKNASAPFHVAKLLFHSYATSVGGNDKESVAEAAFESLAKNPGWYSNVKLELSKLIEAGKKLPFLVRTPGETPSDPYSFCKFFMNTSTKHQGTSPSIDESYKKIQYTKK